MIGNLIDRVQLPNVSTLEGDDVGANAQKTRDQLVGRFAQIQESLNNRWPEDKIEPSLERVARAVELLADPQSSFPTIHVAGTNAKTSTVRLIDQLALTLGLRTGRFTSPHLESVRERISIAGEPIAIERLVENFDDIAPYVEIVDAESIGQGGPAMSTFEVLTVLALASFAEAPVDAAVVEVGMGGRWDATNVIDASVSVITPIGLDHSEYLGNTLEQIAGEKAGIIKPGGIVVVAQQDPAVMEVIVQRAREVGAQLIQEGVDFQVADRQLAVGGQLIAVAGLGGLYDEIFLPLHGEHQAHNAAVALVAFESFLGGGHQRLDVSLVREAFAQATSPGRLEIIRRSPTILVDAAHNPHGARATAEALRESFDFGSIVAVLGVMQDKDVEGIVTAFADGVDVVVATAAQDPRAMPAQQVGQVCAQVLGADRVVVVPDLIDALEAAVALADDATNAGSESAAVVVVGSVALAGQARALLRRARGISGDDL
ncbi:MAG: dihydrofolate synthase [Actinobacteria bacterium]|nr:dihydrofolate synthase [Actinomycetota bacterium]